MPRTPCLDLPAEPRAGRQARGWVLDHVVELGLAPLADTVELLVGELVANVVLHAGTRMTVLVQLLDQRTLEIQVRDGSPSAPTRVHYGLGATTGRGTVLLDALADAWGHEEHEDGKTVWFRGRLPEQPDEAADDAGPDAALAAMFADDVAGLTEEPPGRTAGDGR